MTTQLISYLNFNGNCRDAMTFYQHCLGGELILQRISESPMAAQMPSSASAHILHSSLLGEGIAIFGSDMMGSNLKVGNNIGLCINCNTNDEITVFFSKLSEGGKIKMPLHQSFWGATYGELTDKFGINWMFNFSKN